MTAHLARHLPLQAELSDRILRRSQKRGFPYAVTVAGYRFLVLKGVFSPAYFQSTTPFSDCLAARPLGRFLEIGAGVGATSLIAVMRGAATSATLVDINPCAVRNCRLNTLAYGLTAQVQCTESDIFDGLHRDDRYDSIYWNLPFIWKPSGFRHRDLLQRSLFDPGYRATRRLLDEARTRLKPGGSLYLGFADFGDAPRLAQMLATYGWTAKTIGSWPAREGGRVEFQMLEAHHAGG